MTLAAFAADPDQSRGRAHQEVPPGARSEFQRDRDRIVHSSAFRRLVYKTQVFINSEGDLFRTRLTHSLEVAQIARTLARTLGLNEDLCETVSLAHDLGHTPFGHAGQEALNACMAAHGGFEHNLQSLRVVDQLEDKYADFRGLNLTFEAREGILKHCSKRNAESLGAVGQRFLNREQPGAEAQLTNLADELAYNNHDIDDGLRAGLLEPHQLAETRLFGRFYQEVRSRYGELPPRRARHETIRRMINHLVTDLTDESRTRLDALQPDSIDSIRRHSSPVIAHSDATAAESRELKRYLADNLYRHPRVHRMTRKAKRIISDLFGEYTADARLLPLRHQQAAEHYGLHRAVADYIAGMTDRFAIDEHERLFSPRRL